MVTVLNNRLQTGVDTTLMFTICFAFFLGRGSWSPVWRRVGVTISKVWSPSPMSWIVIAIVLAFSIHHICCGDWNNNPTNNLLQNYGDWLTKWFSTYNHKPRLATCPCETTWDPNKVSPREGGHAPMTRQTQLVRPCFHRRRHRVLEHHASW